MDNSAMYLAVAGTLTPWAVIVLDGWLTWVPLVAAWGVAAVGILQLAFFPGETTGSSIVVAVTLGWLGALLLVPMASRVPWTALLVALAGGILYSAGVVVVLTHWPRLWPRVFSYHEVFHLLVIGGSAAHYFMIWRWVAPFPTG